eukprot:6212354-Pleurochrysis_carterae.AAC.2
MTPAPSKSMRHRCFQVAISAHARTRARTHARTQDESARPFSHKRASDCARQHTDEGNCIRTPRAGGVLKFSLHITGMLAHFPDARIRVSLRFAPKWAARSRQSGPRVPAKMGLAFPPKWASRSRHACRFWDLAGASARRMQRSKRRRSRSDSQKSSSGAATHPSRCPSLYAPYDPLKTLDLASIIVSRRRPHVSPSHPHFLHYACPGSTPMSTSS